jgi:dihydrofolate reductase
MRKLILIAHTSLDGFVSDPNGKLDGFVASDENLGFVAKITESSDAALFGRVSYQLLESFWPGAADRPNATPNEIAYSNWYNTAEKIILSKTLVNPALKNTTIVSDHIGGEILRIKQKPGKDILIFGSPSAFQTLHQLDLVDAYWVFINPVIFGKGIPLFTGTENTTKLRLLETKPFMNGEVAMHFSIA